MNANVKSVVVLTGICLVVAALLAVTNYFSAPVIEANKAAAVIQSLTQVMPEGEDFEAMTLPEDAPATVTGIYRETSGQGYVVLLSTTSQYSSDNMTFSLGVGADGLIKGVAMTGYYESKDFGSSYPETYVGADSALNGIDTVAGVTYSSTAFKNAVADAFTVLQSAGYIAAGQRSSHLAQNSAADRLYAAMNAYKAVKEAE